MRERDRPAWSAGLARRDRDQPHAVAAGVEQGAVRVAAGEADRDAAGQQVAQAREQAEPLAAAPELDVEPRDRVHLGAAALGTTSPACSESTAGVVSEGLNELDESATAEIRSLPLRAEGDRPRDLQRAGAAGDEQHRALGRAAVGRRAVQPRAQRHRRVAARLQPHPARLRLELEARRCPCCGRGRAACASRRCGSTSCCEACQPSPSAWPNASATGSAVISPAALSPRSTRPGALGGDALVRDRARLAGQQAPQVERAQARAAPGRARPRRRRPRRPPGSSR